MNGGVERGAAAGDVLGATADRTAPIVPGAGGEKHLLDGDRTVIVR